MTAVAAPQRQILLPAAAVLAVLTVLLQTTYPLVHGSARSALTIVTVVAFFAATVTHALGTRGGRWTTGFLLITAGGGLVAEAVGTRTGWPFGAYHYTEALGAQLLGVPVVIPLAWAMFGYPCLLVGQRLAATPVRAALVGALALASWDVFLDPQMVAAGHWRWADVRHTVPGISGIPVSNFAGWLVVAALMLGLLQLLPRGGQDDRLPCALFAWTYVSSVLANAAFFGRPGVALVGGLVMGLVALPLLRTMRHPRPAAAARPAVRAG